MASAKHRRHLHAAIAVIERRGRYLICRRHQHDSFGGYWEFPGGKREVGESWDACLRRELREEIGVSVRAVKPYDVMRHKFSDGTVFFRVFRCAIAHGTPRPLDSQSLRWVSASQLSRYKFPPANRHLITRLVEEDKEFLKLLKLAKAPGGTTFDSAEAFLKHLRSL